MGTIEQQLLSIEDDTQNANVVKEIVLAQLYNDEVITKAQYVDYTENWQIMLYKKSWFKKLTSKDKNSWHYKFFRLNNKNGKDDITLS